jgi:hypothetical protein
MGSVGQAVELGVIYSTKRMSSHATKATTTTIVSQMCQFLTITDSADRGHPTPFASLAPRLWR